MNRINEQRYSTFFLRFAAIVRVTTNTSMSYPVDSNVWNYITEVSRAVTVQSKN